MRKGIRARTALRGAIIVVALTLVGPGCLQEVNKAGPPAPMPDTARLDVEPSPELHPQGSPLDFALNLFRESFEEDGATQNVLVSPYSVTEAFTLACAGAAGDTRDAIARVLGFESSDVAEILQSRSSLRERLMSLAPYITLTVANSVWITDRAGITFRPEFVKTCGDILGAEARTADFSDPATERLINDWVGRNTQGKIPSIIDGIPVNQTAALVSSVCMRSPWQFPFNVDMTEKAQFNLASGATAECDVMRRGAHVKYLDGEGFQVVRFPYAADKMAMYLFLPDEGTNLATFIDGLSATGWSQWKDEVEPADVRIGLPRFKFEYGIDLVPTLSGLGMGIAFDPAEADFNTMCKAPEGTPVWIGSAYHRALISVDEEGTEAAGVPYIGGLGSPPAYTVDITFDRPFLFAVVEDTDPNVVLFIGSVIRP